MSGTGKSTLVQELRRRGFVAYDADDHGFSEPRASGRWGWRRDLVADLLGSHTVGLLFFAGCSEEQAELPFDFRVLLTAPEALLVSRLRARTRNAYGHTTAELDQVLSDRAKVEPLLRSRGRPHPHEHRPASPAGRCRARWHSQARPARRVASLAPPDAAGQAARGTGLNGLRLIRGAEAALSGSQRCAPETAAVSAGRLAAVADGPSNVPITPGMGLAGGRRIGICARRSHAVGGARGGPRGP
jgi:hypothetical protein